MDDIFFNSLPNINNVVPPKHIQQRLAEDNYASEFCKHILQSIQEFDSTLDNEKEVAVRLVSFGQAVTFSVRSIGYSNPSLIYFNGILEDGSDVQLIQHVSQISFLLTSCKRPNPNEKKVPIGFKPNQE